MQGEEMAKIAPYIGKKFGKTGSTKFQNRFNALCFAKWLYLLNFII
jgi:hypothetical protein